MNIIDFPDELLLKIISLCDWKSMLMFLSTNNYFNQLKKNKTIVDILKKSFFKNINVEKINNDTLPFYTILEKEKIPQCQKYYYNIIDKVKYCHFCSYQILKAKKTVDYTNEIIYLINKRQQEDIDIGSLTYINLDYLNNMIVSSINNYGSFCNDSELIYDFALSLLYFEKLILQCSLYTNLFAEVILKNLPTFLIKLLKNNFYESKYIIKTMSVLKEFYLKDIIQNNVLPNDSQYDNLYCYIHVLKTCIKNCNNKPENIKTYLDEIYHILDLSRNCFYKIQLVKHCLNLYEFLCYYSKDSINISHTNIILNDIKNNDYCLNVGNVVSYTINVLQRIIRYTNVEVKYYSFLYKLLEKAKNEDVFIGSIIVDILTIGMKRKNFVDSYSRIFLKDLEDIINCRDISEQNLLRLTKLIIDKMLFIDDDTIKKLLKFTYDNINTNSNKEDVKYLAEYLEYVENIENIGSITSIPKQNHFSFNKLFYEIEYSLDDDKFLKPPEGLDLYELYNDN